MRKKKKEELWEEQARKRLEEIYLAHGSMMFSTAMRILNHREDAEDAVQNSVISLANHMDAVGEVTDYKTISYIRTTVKHAAIDIYRKKKKGDMSYEELLVEPDDGTGPEQMACANEQIRYIVKTISSLTPTYREVLSLFYLNELSPKEISKVMHLPYNTIRARIHRGRKLLQAALEKGESL